MKKIVGMSFVLLLNWTGFTQTSVGKWVTIDDKTGKKKSIVELYKDDTKLFGKIVYLYPTDGQVADPKCDKCSDDRKNKPILGLQIVRDLKWNGTEWESGTIVDPENGKIYTLKLWRDESNPEKLNVRGYIGPFFRTQTWIKAS